MWEDFLVSADDDDVCAPGPCQGLQAWMVGFGFCNSLASLDFSVGLNLLICWNHDDDLNRHLFTKNTHLCYNYIHTLKTRGKIM
jgi:hypothetical protein